MLIYVIFRYIDSIILLAAGPGPAVYELKTLTGANDHCRTKPQAPSYSIGHNVRSRDNYIHDFLP